MSKPPHWPHECHKCNGAFWFPDYIPKTSKVKIPPHITVLDARKSSSFIPSYVPACPHCGEPLIHSLGETKNE